jgi:multiple sugar transport system permease protein
MPLVGSVGRKRPRAIIAMTVLYIMLAIGAVTTLYPFALMVTTGFKGPTDQNDNKLVPTFWNEFDTIDPESKKLKPESLFGKYLNDKYKGDIPAIDSTRIGVDASAEQVAEYEKFLMSLPTDYWEVGFRTQANQVTSKLSIRYQDWLRNRFKDIDELNKAYIEENVAFQTVVAPNELLERNGWKLPAGRKYVDWLEFKRALPAEFRLPIRSQRIYQTGLAGKHQNQWGDYLVSRYPGVEKPPAADPEGATKFEEVRLPTGAEYAEFKRTKLPERYRKQTVEELWAARGQKGDLPIAAYERQFVLANKADIRGEFNGRNFRFVLDYAALHGRALWNTAIFCILAILTQLIVNPLAAYALSRYPIRASGKILLFLLATMAFPAEVAMIPSFLLLKDLGMLNTFAALVLPTAASGYMIFLLKGFFDSLPQEVFESGQIDGAKETTLMFRMAFPLSKPVFGYMALLAFMSAYGAFLYAFLVAQDQKMWTLMVWIYQLQNTAPKAVMMAAVTLAALPTIIVFLAAQRVIMRGIVLPGER